MPTDHNFWRERRTEADSNRGPSALPLGQTGSQQRQLHITRDNLIMQLNTRVYLNIFTANDDFAIAVYFYFCLFLLFACPSTQFPSFLLSRIVLFFVWSERIDFSALLQRFYDAPRLANNMAMTFSITRHVRSGLGLKLLFLNRSGSAQHCNNPCSRIFSCLNDTNPFNFTSFMGYYILTLFLYQERCFNVQPHASEYRSWITAIWGRMASYNVIQNRACSKRSHVNARLQIS